MVNVGKSSTPLGYAHTHHRPVMPAPPDAAVTTTWAPTPRCSVSAEPLRSAASFEERELEMSAFTHALFRVDAALTVDPATGRNATPDLRTRHPGNAVVAILWIQGALGEAWWKEEALEFLSTAVHNPNLGFAHLFCGVLTPAAVNRRG